MVNLLKSISLVFKEKFKHKHTHIIQAPGRVNLIGEHTDYNNGFVLPCAIDFQVIVAASVRGDNIISLFSANYNQADEFDLSERIDFHETMMWANYIRGVVQRLVMLGYKLKGINIVVSGNVPQGAGLSSSAALEVAIGQTFKTLCDLDITQDQIALCGQQAENVFVGCNCGIMDQLISAKGEEGHALLIDCRTLETKSVPIPDDLSIVIVNSNKTRGLVDSEYNTRRKQCEQAAVHFGVKALRDVTLKQFTQREHELDPVIAMRARHVITENTRTKQAAKALKLGHIKKISQLMALSHISMRDDFEITVKEIDILVDIIKDKIGNQGGVRMTGGGFGGCVVVLVPSEIVNGVISAVHSQYQSQTGLNESIYVCQARNGSGPI
ncbi:MAG: galactokinase [Psychromonas sp.]|nr:galactokinase [Psychromonas sp.]